MSAHWELQQFKLMTINSIRISSIDNPKTPYLKHESKHMPIHDYISK